MLNQQTLNYKITNVVSTLRNVGSTKTLQKRPLNLCLTDVAIQH